MSTAENKAEGSSIKKAKRTADRQISKDDDPEEDGEAEGSVAGEFQRASEEVLKTRRIVKAKVRVPSSSAGAQSSGSANPFRTVVLPSSRSTQDDSAGGVNGTTTGTIAATATASTATCSVSGDGISVPLHENSEKSSSPEAVQPMPVASAKVEEESTSACTGKPNEMSGTETEKTTGDESSEGGGKGPGKGEESKEGTEGQSTLASPSKAGSEKQNGAAEGDEERGGVENGSSISKKTETPSSGAFGGGAGSGKVISFEGFGTGSGSFQSLLKGANPLGAPLSFGGFGSKAGTTPAMDGAPPLGSSTTSVGNPLSLGSPSASFGTVSTSSSNAAEGNGGGGAKVAGPVLSFGASAGSGGGFKSFDSVASVGRLWGSSPKGKGAEADAALGETSSKEEATKTSLELMDPSEVVNGEESEECMHRTRAKLFRLANKEWTEMGIGTIKALRSAGEAGVVNDDGNKGEEEGERDSHRGKVSSRLVMRREAGQQVILNVALQEQTRCSMNGEKALMIACFTPDGPATYLLKVKTSEDARNLKAAIDTLLTEKSG